MVLLVAIGSVSVVSSNLNSGARMAVYRGGDGLKPRLLVSTAILLTALALVACSGGEGPDTVEPAVEASPAATATETRQDDVATPSPVKEIGEQPELSSTPRGDRGGRTAEIYTRTPEPEPRLNTLPWVEFPDDVAVLARLWSPLRSPADSPEHSLVRIYRSDNGDLVRETLPLQFAPMAARPDASLIVRTECVEPKCYVDGMTFNPDDDHSPGRTALYESRDGLVTWEKLVEFDMPWFAELVLPDEDGETRLLLIFSTAFFQDASGDELEWLGRMLWPSKDPFSFPPVPEGYEVHRWLGPLALPDGRLAWGMKGSNSSDDGPEDIYLTVDGEDVTELVPEQAGSCPECLMLPDGRLFLRGEDYPVEDLIGPYGAAEGFYEDPFQRGTIDWPAIRDPDTGEQWPIRLPHNVLQPGYILVPFAIQHGPFLQVTDVDGCLPIRAEPSPAAEDLACMVERVLLTDLAEASEVDGATWHRVRTPAGVEGWADSRYLE